MGDFAYSVPGTGSRPGTANAAGEFNYSRPSGSDLVPPGSSGGLNIGYAGYPPNGPPGSAHGVDNKSYSNHDQHAPPQSAASNQWGYTVPSPPQTAQSVVSNAGPPPPPSHAANGQLMYGYHGYNTSNTRPMTAPSSSVNGPSYYHGGQYGAAAMFSPATYSGAGFPSNFAARAAGPSHSGQAIRQPYNASTSHHHNPTLPGSAGLSSEPPYSANASEIFSHQPPPLSSTALGAPSQYQNYYFRPGTDYAARRTLESLDERYRPGTSDTVRPDTGISTYSGYSAQGPSGAYPGSAMPGGAPMNPLAMQNPDLTHPSYYHMAGNGPNASGNPLDPSSDHLQHEQQGQQQQQKWSFVPLPSQPKKRPRRRFEEIERLYDCNYPGCNKAYGTLNHLNAHVSMQKHGPKRVPSEFKEVRKAWRQRKKESEAAAAAVGDDGGQGDRRGGYANDDEEDDNEDQGHPSAYQTQAQAQSQHYQQPPQLSSVPSDMRHPNSRPQTQQQDITPPNSTHFPSTPSFAHYAGFGQFPPGHPGNYNNVNNGAVGGHYPSISPVSYGRPSTAPSHMVHHAFGQLSNGGTPTISSSSNSHHVSPLIGSFPAGYNPAIRKQSITSIPPAFASIQEQEEEPVAGEAAVDVFSQFKDARRLSDPNDAAYQHQHQHQQPGSSPGESRLFPAGNANHALSTSPNNLEILNNHIQSQGNSPARPHTASSPFRSSAGGVSDGGAYDNLGRVGKSIATGTEGDQQPGGMVAPRSADPAHPSPATMDLNGRWSPGTWSQGQVYKQEIR